MKKILISSTSLYNYIDKCLNVKKFPQQIKLTAKDEKFIVSPMDAKSKGVFYHEIAGAKKSGEITIEIGRLYKLRAFLELIGEQPIVISLDEGNDFIFIRECII